MKEGIYRLLLEKTKDFPFSKFSDEPLSGTDEELLSFRLKSLINQIMKMAVKKYYQMPASFRLNHTKDHWIQDAMIILWNLCLTYNPKQGTFDHYVRFMMPRRLTSIQRNIFNENPQTDDNPENVIKERMFVSGDDDMAEKRESEESISLETQYIQEEARKILWDCIEKLEPISGQLFMRHEFDEISFEKLYEDDVFRHFLECKSLTVFQRRYREKVFGQVHNCVRSQY